MSFYYRVHDEASAARILSEGFTVEDSDVFETTTPDGRVVRPRLSGIPLSDLPTRGHDERAMLGMGFPEWVQLRIELPASVDLRKREIITRHRPNGRGPEPTPWRWWCIPAAELQAMKPVCMRDDTPPIGPRDRPPRRTHHAR